MSLPAFRLEEYFAQWEFRARYHLTASDAQTMSVSELLAYADDEDRRAWDELTLGYTQTQGDPGLRAAVAATYESIDADHLLVFGGPSEAITMLCRTLLRPDDHAVVVVPNYQSAETVPAALCATTGVALRADEHWALDVDAVAAALRPNTKLVLVNFPNNPTGAVPDHDRWQALLELVARRGCYLFSDEIYRGVETDPARTLPSAADRYERAVSLNGVSKAYGLPGLRVGWLAAQDRELLHQVERAKDYGSICASAPSEVLARIAVRAVAPLMERTRRLLAANLPRFDEFFARYPDRFDYRAPDGGCVCFPKYLGADGAEALCRDAVTEAGVLLLPSSLFASDLAPVPADRFRIGVGRADAAECLAAFGAFLDARG